MNSAYASFAVFFNSSNCAKNALPPSSFIAHNPATIPSSVIHSSSSSPPPSSFGVKLFLTYRLFALFLGVDLSSLDSVDSLTDLFTAFYFWLLISFLLPTSSTLNDRSITSSSTWGMAVPFSSSFSFAESSTATSLYSPFSHLIENSISFSHFFLSHLSSSLRMIASSIDFFFLSLQEAH